jgi:peptidoglycan/xylan/chitin deacetylase (PgdA/CDA1 family)/SAM-dependent methyltransferase
VSAHPAIAVVVTCHDLGRYLDDALASVAAQTWPAIELIVVDDGSEDLFTLEALERVRQRGVRVIRTPNRGVSAARNTGAKLTASPYLVMLDADDRLDSEYLAAAIAAFEADPDLDFVSCGVQCEGLSTERWIPPQPTLLGMITEAPLHVSTVVRRSLWLALGGYDEGFRALEDLDFWTRALAGGARGRVLEHPYLTYRVRPGSNWHRGWSADRHPAHMAAFYAKHRAVIERLGPDAFVALERFVVSRRRELEDAQQRRAVLDRRIAEAQASLRELEAARAAAGQPRVDFGDLARLGPFSPFWGLERGQPLDRHYIEQFLDRWRQDVRGRVLEVKDDAYTKRLGGDRVTANDIVDIDSANAAATIHADLTDAATIPSDTYDCFICTQTLGLVFDVGAAVREAARILKPGGVLLCTVPANGRLSAEAPGPDGDFWRFGEAAVRRLFAEAFGPRHVDVTPFGNVQTAAAFLYGLNPDDVDPAALDACDPSFPVVYGVRAVKPHRGRMSQHRLPALDCSVVLAYHRIRLDPYDEYATPPDMFERHLDWLQSEGWEFVGLGDILTPDGRGRRVALTFDDGYDDHLEVVAPILAARRCCATFFVLPDEEPAGEPWWDTLRRIFLGEAVLPPRFDARALPALANHSTATAFDRRRAHDRLRDLCYDASLDERQRILAVVRAWSGDADPPSAGVLPAARLRTLSAMPGIDIGSHTINHLLLPRQPDPVQRRELDESKRRLEETLHRPVTMLAYPYGGWDAGVVRLAAEAGYTMAVTTDGRAVAQGDARLAVPRISVDAYSVDQLAARLDEAAGRG